MTMQGTETGGQKSAVDSDDYADEQLPSAFFLYVNQCFNTPSVDL